MSNPASQTPERPPQTKENTTYINNIETLKAERASITKQLQPLNLLSAEKRSELGKLESDISAADAALDAAIKTAATAEGIFLIHGDASSTELATAKQARRVAEKAHAATQAASVGVRTLTAEITGLQAAGYGLATRLIEIDNEQAEAEKNYLRAEVDSVCAEYSQAARDLTQKLSAVLAANQALAMSGGNPNLLSPAIWNFAVAALESPSARPANAGGWLYTIDDARQGQAAALAGLRQRIVDDGIAIAGLT